MGPHISPLRIQNTSPRKIKLSSQTTNFKSQILSDSTGQYIGTKFVPHFEQSRQLSEIYKWRCAFRAKTKWVYFSPLDRRVILLIKLLIKIQNIKFAMYSLKIYMIYSW